MLRITDFYTFSYRTVSADPHVGEASSAIYVRKCADRENISHRRFDLAWDLVRISVKELAFWAEFEFQSEFG